MATLVNFSEDLTLKFYIKRYDNNCIEYVQIWDSLASLPEIYAEPEIRNKLKVSAESKPDGFEFRNNGNLYDEDGHNIIGKIRFISDYDHNDDSDNDLVRQRGNVYDIYRDGVKIVEVETLVQPLINPDYKPAEPLFALNNFGLLTYENVKNGDMKLDIIEQFVSKLSGKIISDLIIKLIKDVKQEKETTNPTRFIDFSNLKLPDVSNQTSRKNINIENILNITHSEFLLYNCLIGFCKFRKLSDVKLYFQDNNRMDLSTDDYKSQRDKVERQYLINSVLTQLGPESGQSITTALNNMINNGMLTGYNGNNYIRCIISAFIFIIKRGLFQLKNKQKNLSMSKLYLMIKSLNINNVLIKYDEIENLVLEIAIRRFKSTKLTNVAQQYTLLTNYLMQNLFVESGENDGISIQQTIGNDKTLLAIVTAQGRKYIVQDFKHSPFYLQEYTHLKQVIYANISGYDILSKSIVLYSGVVNKAQTLRLYANGYIPINSSGSFKDDGYIRTISLVTTNTVFIETKEDIDALDETLTNNGFFTSVTGGFLKRTRGPLTKKTIFIGLVVLIAILASSTVAILRIFFGDGSGSLGLGLIDIFKKIFGLD